MDNYTAARGKLPGEILCLMTDERKTAIRQAGLGILDTEIAMRYYIDRLPHADIAAIVGRDRSTVSRRLKSIEPQITNPAHRLSKIPQ